MTYGLLMVAIAGLASGSFVWPMKLMRRLKFEHWFLVSMFVGLVALPWTVTLVWCPHALASVSRIDRWALVKTNLFGLAWGFANVLGGVCFERIGVAITGGFLTGLGVSVGVITPMVFKGSGQFRNAPNISSAPGMVTLCSVAIMLIAVVLMSLAGFGRERALKAAHGRSRRFAVGLTMAVAAGITSAGLGLAFVYGQSAIVEAMRANGAGETPAGLSVWAVGLIGAALVNIGYPAVLIQKNRSWNVFREAWREVGLAAVIGVQFFAGIAFMAKGMLLLGAAGASVGIGIQQAMQTLGNQGLGIISGEWRGVHGLPRRRMYAAIALTLTAAAVLAYARTIAG